MSVTAPENTDHLVDGKYGICDLVDIERLRGIFEKFTLATGFTIGFLDHPGLNILAATGWRDICTKFHRGCPASAAICVKSNGHLLNSLDEPGRVMIEACENGLTDCATPVIIKGKHIASLATGQLLLEPPDLERFRRQAKLYGFEEEAYLAALREIPVVSRETLSNVTLFLGEIASVISEMGYTNLVIKEESKKLTDEIAQHKLAELEKEKLNLSLIEKDREMENFLYITTHDLRGPLVNIEGFSQNLERYTSELRAVLAQLPPEARAKADKLAGENIPRALKFVLESSRKMDALITALLKVSRAGRVEMRPGTVEMNGLLKKILASLRYQLEEAGCEIKCGSLPPCWADPDAVSQIFVNLLDNAVKYRHKDRASVIELSGEVKGGRVVYALADNGSGIPEPDMRSIWEVFYRASGKKGEGIGLPIVKLIAEKNGGAIRAESREGEGSVFYVELPAAEGGQNGK